MYQELQEPEPIRSMGFLRELDRLHSTGHEPRLPKTFEQYGLQAPVPVTYENIGLEEYHPTLRLRSMIETLSRVDGKIDHLLVGNGPAELRSFWCNYRKLHPQHDVFNDHATRLDACVPMMLHLDEGYFFEEEGDHGVIGAACLWQRLQKKQEHEHGYQLHGQHLLHPVLVFCAFGEDLHHEEKNIV